MQPPVEPNARASRLSSVLDEHREELERLPGVIGIGVGLSRANPTDYSDVVIQVFVSQTAARGTIERRAAEIVGREHPLEIVHLSVPHADAGER